VLGPLPKHIRIAKVIQNEPVGYTFGFVNDLFKSVSILDPRFKAFPMDLKEYEAQLNENGSYMCAVDPETLRKFSINIQYFNSR
jgi:hypothetical protein